MSDSYLNESLVNQESCDRMTMAYTRRVQRVTAYVELILLTGVQAGEIPEEDLRYNAYKALQQLLREALQKESRDLAELFPYPPSQSTSPNFMEHVKEFCIRLWFRLFELARKNPAFNICDLLYFMRMYENYQRKLAKDFGHRVEGLPNLDL